MNMTINETLKQLECFDTGEKSFSNSITYTAVATDDCGAVTSTPEARISTTRVFCCRTGARSAARSKRRRFGQKMLGGKSRSKSTVDS